MNLSVDIAGVTMKNPVTTGSGTFGSGEEFSEFVDLSKLGAVTTKGVANVPWPGNPVPRVAEVYGGMLNAIGLQNPGIDVFVERVVLAHQARRYVYRNDVCWACVDVFYERGESSVQRFVQPRPEQAVYYYVVGR